MTHHTHHALREALALATGPTISASRNQTCGWCLDPIAAAEPITYTKESGWCHEACTMKDEQAAAGL